MDNENIIAAALHVLYLRLQTLRDLDPTEAVEADLSSYYQDSLEEAYAALAQVETEIDQLNAKLKGIRLFKGIECDILADGRLDYDDDVLASFDYVVASVHSYFNKPETEMTARVIKAFNCLSLFIAARVTTRSHHDTY